jgi:hypothetical protein
MEMIMSKPWERFFFESNQFYDYIDNMEDWQRLRDAYPSLTDDQLLNAKEATYSGQRSLEDRESAPNYGFRWEHDGKRTLRDFFAANGMSLELNVHRELPPPTMPENTTESYGG